MYRAKTQYTLISVSNTLGVYGCGNIRTHPMSSDHTQLFVNSNMTQTNKQLTWSITICVCDANLCDALHASILLTGTRSFTTYMCGRG